MATPAGQAAVDCKAARPADPKSISGADLVVGPLRFPGLIHGFDSTRSVPDSNGVTFYKVGVQLPAATTATVTIGGPARSHVGIRTESGPPAGYTSVTYSSCSSADPSAYFWWVGGFTVIGGTETCIPLDVRVKGEDSVRKITIPMNSTGCA
jgi:hypothetical protein